LTLLVVTWDLELLGLEIVLLAFNFELSTDLRLLSDELRVVAVDFFGNSSGGKKAAISSDEDSSLSLPSSDIGIIGSTSRGITSLAASGELDAVSVFKMTKS